MKKTLLIELLSTFSVRELRRWSDFIHSDYHCKNKHLRQLSELLLPIVKKQRTSEKYDIWTILFPKATYNEIKFNNYLSDLLAVSYRFLEEETFVEKRNTRYEYLQQQLIDRELKLQATRVARKWEKSLNDSQLNNSSAFFEQFRYHSIQNDFGILSEKKRAFDSHLQKKSISFEHFYLLQQLTNYAEMLNSLHTVKGNHKLPYLNKLLSKYKENKLKEQSIKGVEILVLIVEMLIGGNDAEQKFTSAGILMQHNLHCFSQFENKVIYNYLINFCVKKINLGILSYHQKLFNIYQTLIEKNLLLRNGQISQWTYRNIIAVGINVNGWEFTQDFLENYKAFLPEADRHNAYYYNLAVLNFERQEYDKALTPLNELKYADAFYQMAAKTILLKIYYTLHQNDAFEALVAASRQFIIRNKQLSDYQQNSSLNFISLLQKMASFRQIQKIWSPTKRKNRMEYFKNKLESPDYPVSNKGWLNKELEQLKIKAQIS